MDNVNIAPLESSEVNQNDKNEVNVGTSSTGVHQQDSVQRLQEPIIYYRRRGPKRKRLDELVVDSVTTTTVKQDEENEEREENQDPTPITINEESPKNNADCVLVDTSEPTTSRKEKAPARRQPPPPMPKKEILEYILNKLQERDTGNQFARPVDSNEVDGYYEIIKTPMDFGTLRKNLADGLYKSFDEFEHDVLAIFKNAMEYNSKLTVYFRQARQIHELAKSYFRKLKTDSSKVTQEFEQQTNMTSTRSRRTRTKYATSTRIRYDNEIELSDSAYERRHTWKPSTFEHDQYTSIFSRNGASERQLIPGNGGISYRRSLKLFSKDLGPTVQRVAHQKLATLSSIQNLPRLGATQNEPAGNRRILNSVARRGNSLRIENFMNPSHIQPRMGTNLAPQLSMSANLQSHNNQNQSGTHFPYVGYQSFSSSTTDARGKQIVSGNADQHRPTSFSSAPRPSLQEFWHRNSRQAKASVQPSRVVQPSRLSQCDTLNNRFALANQSASPSLMNQNVRPFSFTQLLLSEDDITGDYMALLLGMRSSVSSAMDPQRRNEFDTSSQNASALLPGSNSSFSFMQLLMDEGDISPYEAALVEEMRNRRTHYGHDQSSFTHTQQQQQHQVGTSARAWLNIGQPSSTGSHQPDLALHLRNLNLGK